MKQNNVTFPQRKTVSIEKTFLIQMARIFLVHIVDEIRNLTMK